MIVRSGQKNLATAERNPPPPHPVRPKPAPSTRRLQRGSKGFSASSAVRSFEEILWRIAHAKRANKIPNAQLQADVAEAMERTTRGIHKAGSLAEQVGNAGFVAILDMLGIKSMATISRLETLKSLVDALEREAARLAA